MTEFTYDALKYKNVKKKKNLTDNKFKFNFSLGYLLSHMIFADLYHLDSLNVFSQLLNVMKRETKHKRSPQMEL